jgi:hypothetical protein
MCSADKGQSTKKLAKYDLYYLSYAVLMFNGILTYIMLLLGLLRLLLTGNISCCKFENIGSVSL